LIRKDEKRRSARVYSNALVEENGNPL